jgi:uncharacterized protein YcaQ
MRSNRAHPSTAAIAAQHPDAVGEMRGLLASGARLSSREVEASGTETRRTYRGSKARALALYYLWRTGEAMTFERRGFERVYAATEAVAPPAFLGEVDERAALRFIAAKGVAADGIGTLALPSHLTDLFGRKITKTEREELKRDLLELGAVVEVQVQGWRGRRFVAAADVPALDAVANGAVPEEWRGGDAGPVASFLSPLDPVVARGRSSELFGFEHVWEIYKRAEEVKYGRFTMPVLWGDALVGRVDARFDRTRRALVVNGIWLEDENDTRAADALPAIADEFVRLLAFLGGSRVEFTTTTGSAMCRDYMQEAVGA